MLKAIVGHSDDPDSNSAIAEVIAHCQTELKGCTPQAGILFAAIDFDHALILQQIDQAFPNLELIGCTSDAELSDMLRFQHDSVVLTLLYSDEIEIRAGVARNLGEDTIAATRKAVEQAISNDRSPRLCITIPEGIKTDGNSILSGLQAALGQNFPIFGGISTDDFRFEATYQFYKTEVLTDAAPILLFSGEALRFSHGVASGWQPISAPGTVTQSQKNLVTTIGEQSALSFYREQLGGSDPLPQHPLAVFESDETSFYLRGFSGFDDTTGELHCLADIPESAVVQVSTASREDILAASKTAILQATQSYPGSTPSVAIIFSCDCRFKLLGSQVKEEYEWIRSCLSDEVTCSGFYTYGELAPLSEYGVTRLHNHTIVTLLLGT
ncbi:MAG: FIST C-terminal domain-containing protein [Leptolyngbya sp. Prado105]|jgi:hypothetical protein|nr:FIST C-terminal domain-containing protein [Leptolyngbya sp. Prado105]